MNRSRDCFDLLCPFLCPYNPVRLTIHPSQLSLSNKMSTSHLHNLSSPSPVNSCKLPSKNRPNFTFGEESCPITWCISAHSAQFPSCLWRSFAMQSKSISQSSQTFSNLEQCVSSADALVTLHLTRNADFLGSKHWAFHSLCARWVQSYITSKSPSVFFLNIPLRPLMITTSSFQIAP